MKRVSPHLSRLAAALLVASLVACETPVSAPQFPDITFGHMPPIRLDVADVEFVAEYAPPQAPPNVEHLFPVRPAAAVKRWAEERIEPAGVMRRAKVTLVNAAVIEVPLDKKSGLAGVFWNEQSERYDGIVEVRVEIVDDRGFTVGRVRAVAQRSQTVPEDVTLNEREQVWYKLTEALMKDLDAELENSIRKYLQEYVR